MNKTHLEHLRKWFAGYVSNYYTGDAEYDRPIRLKEDHTGNVCDNLLLLGKGLDLSDQDLLLLETIGLFHDIGRFEQYKCYGTFVDAVSVDHARLGIRQMMTHSVLSMCTATEKRLITKAIAYHNAAVLPETPDDRERQFMCLIRDADKLDVWRVLIDYYHVRNENPSAALELGVPDDPSCSPEIVDALYTKRSALLKDARTVNDAILLQISWVFDLNFAQSMQLVRERNYIPRLLAFLPQTDTVKAAVGQAQSYIEACSEEACSGGLVKRSTK